MSSSQSRIYSDSKDKEKLAKYRDAREKILKENLYKKFKEMGMGILFGWGSEPSVRLEVDVALGVSRPQCLIETLEKVTIFFKENYPDPLSKEKDCGKLR